MNGAEARARVDAEFDARDRAEIARAELLQRSLALRDAAWNGEPIADLRALGIDSPNLRWLAARHYLLELRQDAGRRFERIWLCATFLDLAEANAIARGATLERHGGPDLITRDLLEAKCTILERYRGAARDRAEALIDRYLPTDARTAEPSVAYRELTRELAGERR